MAMVDTVYWLHIGRPAAQARWLDPKVGDHLASFLYSSREPSELSQWLCYDDSTIDIGVIIIIVRDPDLTNIQLTNSLGTSKYTLTIG